MILSRQVRFPKRLFTKLAIVHREPINRLVAMSSRGEAVPVACASERTDGCASPGVRAVPGMDIQEAAASRTLWFSMLLRLWLTRRLAQVTNNDMSTGDLQVRRGPLSATELDAFLARHGR